METRAKVEKQLASREKEKKEERLRNLAQKARDERAGIKTVEDHDEDLQMREDIRRERHKERQRDRNLARAGADKRNRIQRERERDISEKIALGLPNTGGGSRDSEAMFDQRLYNKDRVRDVTLYSHVFHYSLECSSSQWIILTVVFVGHGVRVQGR